MRRLENICNEFNCFLSSDESRKIFENRKVHPTLCATRGNLVGNVVEM